MQEQPKRLFKIEQSTHGILLFGLTKHRKEKPSSPPDFDLLALSV